MIYRMAKESSHELPSFCHFRYVDEDSVNMTSASVSSAIGKITG